MHEKTKWGIIRNKNEGRGKRRGGKKIGNMKKRKKEKIRVKREE